MNETLNIMNNRYSVRSFKEEPIPRHIQDQFINAGLKAASAGNLQPFSIIRIEDKENSKWFVEHHMQGFIEKAPLNLLFCLDFHRLQRWSKHHKAPFVMDKSLAHFWVGFQDVIILAQSIETAANSLGIGSVYVGTVMDYILELQEKFNLPKGVIPIVLLTMGYSNQPKKIARKLSQNLVVHDESYVNHSIDFLEEEFHLKYGDPTIKVTEEIIDKIYTVVKEVDGEKQAEIVKEYVRTQEKVSIPMRYFGLHYVAHRTAKENTKMLDALYKNGLVWAKGENFPK